jgi:hypothetical protein
MSSAVRDNPSQNRIELVAGRDYSRLLFAFARHDYVHTYRGGRRPAGPRHRVEPRAWRT